MCFTITKSLRKPRPRKVRKDIIVFKVISESGRGWMNDIWIDGIIDSWKPGFEYRETTPFKSMRKSCMDTGRWIVSGDAFHSKITYESAKAICMAKSEIVVKMIIPKGALYFKNERDYVSSRIVYPDWEV